MPLIRPKRRIGLESIVSIVQKLRVESSHQNEQVPYPTPFYFRCSPRKLKEKLSRTYPRVLHKLSELCFNLTIKVCSNFCPIQISTDSAMKLTVEKRMWKLVVYYSLIVLQIFRVLHIFWVTGGQVFGGTWDLTTIFSLTFLIVYIIGFGFSSSVLLRPHETVQIVNTIPIILNFYSKGGRVTSLHQNAKNAVSIICSVLDAANCILLASAFGFLVDGFPVSLYHTFESITGRPQSIPYVLWKLFYWPVEFLMLLHVLSPAMFGSMIVLTFPNVAQTYTNSLRTMRVTSGESWMELRRKYNLLRVYLSVVNRWMKLMIVPTKFSCASTVIIAAYITLRHTDIPILIYLGFAWVALVFSCFMLWFDLEVISLVKSTDAIVGVLKKRDEPYLHQLLPGEQKYLIKWGKATRPAVFDVGNFTDYSISVPINIFDEILNQLMLLLTF